MFLFCRPKRFLCLFTHKYWLGFHWASTLKSTVSVGLEGLMYIGGYASQSIGVFDPEHYAH